jgi:hypothetical protein
LVDLQTVGLLVTATSVTIAAAYYIITLRMSQRNIKTTLDTRQAQLFMNTFQVTYTNDWLDALRKLFTIELRDLKDYEAIQRGDEQYKAFYIVAQYLEGVGVLVRENLVDIRLVAELNSGIILWWWGKFGPGILKLRGELNFPRYCVEIEFLAKKVSEYGRTHPELGFVQPNMVVSSAS